jgi:hypothetical protein
MEFSMRAQAYSVCSPSLPPTLDILVVSVAAVDFAAGSALLSFTIPHLLRGVDHGLLTSLHQFLVFPDAMLVLCGIWSLIRRPLAWQACTWALRLAAGMLVTVAAINGVIPLLVAVLLGDGDGVGDAATLSLQLAVPAALALLPAGLEYLLLSSPPVRAAYCGAAAEAKSSPQRWLRRSLVHIAVFACAGFLGAMISFQMM